MDTKNPNDKRGIGDNSILMGAGETAPVDQITSDAGAGADAGQTADANSPADASLENPENQTELLPDNKEKAVDIINKFAPEQLKNAMQVRKDAEALLALYPEKEITDEDGAKKAEELIINAKKYKNALQRAGDAERKPYYDLNVRIRDAIKKPVGMLEELAEIWQERLNKFAAAQQAEQDRLAQEAIDAEIEQQRLKDEENARVLRENEKLKHDLAVAKKEINPDGTPYDPEWGKTPPSSGKDDSKPEEGSSAQGDDSATTQATSGGSTQEQESLAGMDHPLLNKKPASAPESAPTGGGSGQDGGQPPTPPPAPAPSSVPAPAPKPARTQLKAGTIEFYVPCPDTPIDWSKVDLNPLEFYIPEAVKLDAAKRYAKAQGALANVRGLTFVPTLVKKVGRGTSKAK